ncbi:hypothetical protein ACIBQ3_05740 [Streptomyces rubiginosohelvolus]|uniref:hypothetical protein n=1 Tax=Streptomyces rubiginosohelvolus TaxID=67362 RepID=UPI003788C8DA
MGTQRLAGHPVALGVVGALLGRALAEQGQTVWPCSVRVSWQSIRPKVSTRMPRAPERSVPVTTAPSPSANSRHRPRRAEPP